MLWIAQISNWQDIRPPDTCQVYDIYMNNSAALNNKDTLSKGGKPLKKLKTDKQKWIPSQSDKWTHRRSDNIQGHNVCMKCI